MNPREEDNLGTMAYKHSRYCLGEESISDPIDWLEEKLNVRKKHVYTNERLQELEEKFFQKFIGHKLYLYDHSGITISTSPFHCQWDSGQVGYIYVTKEKAREEYGRLTKKKIERILSYLDGEVETFDQYLRGDVYGYEILNEDGEHIDSCHGFFGDDPTTNGIKDSIPKELWPQLENIEIEY